MRWVCRKFRYSWIGVSRRDGCMNGSTDLKLKESIQWNLRGESCVDAKLRWMRDCMMRRIRMSIPGNKLHTKWSCNRSSAAWPWQHHCKPMKAIIFVTCIINLISSHDTRLACSQRLSDRVVIVLRLVGLSSLQKNFKIAEIFSANSFMTGISPLSDMIFVFKATFSSSFDFPGLVIFSLPIIFHETSLVYRESTFRCVLNSGN